jgi:tetratricopeptide (TPR) repeat protein
MITCAYCNAANAANLDACSNCGKTLLPGLTFQERVDGLKRIGRTYLLGAVISISALLVWVELFGSRQSNPGWFAIVIGFLLFFISLRFLIGTVLGLAISVWPRTSQREKYRLRAVRHARLKNYQQAIQDMEKAIELKPEEIDYYQFRAALYFGNNQYEAAKSDIEQALEFTKRRLTQTPDEKRLIRKQQELNQDLRLTLQKMQGDETVT